MRRRLILGRTCRTACARPATTRTFVHCTRSDMEEQAARARERGWRVVEVDAGHLLPLEDPGLCVALLTQSAGALAQCSPPSP